MNKLINHSCHQRITRGYLISRFRRDERGGPAVEFALVAPVLILLIFAIVQFGFAFYTYNDMMNGAREGARRLAVGATMEAAQEQAISSMILERSYSFPPTAPDTDEVTMTIELSLSDAMVVSVLPIPDKMLAASVTMRKEF